MPPSGKAQYRVRPCVLRFDGNSLLQELLGCIIVIARELHHERERLSDAAPGIQAARSLLASAVAFLRVETWLDGRDDVFSDLVLQGKDIVKLPVVLL